MAQYVVWIQWGVVGFFALLHFIIGFKRGAKKSLFYSVLSVILMVLVLFLISFISVRPFLSDANLIKLVERFTSLPESVRASILDNPDSLAVIYALVDLVVKLVAFFVIYPIVKWLLTLIIGLPIWRNYEKTKGHPIRVTHIDSGYSILAKNVSGFQVEYKKSVLGRFAGGFFGFLRGALVGLLLLLPIAVMAGFIKGSTVANTEGDELTASNQAAIPEDIQGWLEVVEAFNNSPIGALYNKPHIGNKTLGEATFDLVINSKIKYQDKKQEKVKFTEEFGPIVKAAISLYQNGYLDDGFDLMEISQENLPDIEMLFKAINSSKLVTGIIPTAGPVGVVYFLDSQGFDVNAHPHAENALKEFSNINFKDELDTVYQIIEKLLLTIDNVGELSKFADINYLLETTIEKRTGLAEVLELVDGINSTVLISLVLDYVVTLPEVQEHISWLPNGTETEDYLREALDFYLDNPRFMQEDELFTKIAKIVRVLLVDKASYGAEEKEAGKKYLDYLYDSIKNPNPDIEAVILKYKDKIDDVEAEIREQLALEKDLDPSLIYQSEIDALLVDTIARFIDQAVDEMERVAYRDDLDFVVRHYNSEILAALLNDDDLQDLILDEKTSQMVVDVLEAFVDINTIMEALPLLVDYAIFVQFGDDLSAVSEELSASLKETDWRKDISTLGDVYHKITSFGLKKALRDEKYGPLIDKLISENKLDLDDIIDRLLVESHAINKIISITAPILVDKFVEDDDLKDGILELIKDFDGEKFEYGLELKRVLNAAVEIQKVIPFEELLDLGDLDEDQIIGIIKSFAGLDDDEYQNLKDAITELQVVKRFNKSLFVYLQKTIESDFLAIPEEELPSVFALDRDLTRLLDIVRSVAVTMDKELVDGASYKDINLANVLAADEVKENLEFKKADKDGLLYLLAVHNIVALNNNEGLQDFVAIPEKLISLPYREEVWRTEINTVISALIGTISLYAGDDTPFVLSLNNVSDVGNNWKDLDKTVLTKLIDNYDETLATFFDSKIVLASVTKTLETQLLPILNDLIKDYQASLPVDILDEDNYVTETAINELFEVLFDIVNQYIEFMNVSQLGDFVSEKEISEYLNFYNNLNVETVEDLAYAKFINGFFRDILADEAVWAFITEIIAEALPADLVDLDIVYFVYALEDERVKEDELFYLLGGLRDLKIDPRLLGDDFDMNVVFEYLDSIENTQLASFLRSNLLIELITNALNDPVIEDYAIKLVSDIITNLKEEEINAGTSLDKRIWTEFELDFDSLFASIRRINDQLIPELFDRNEFIRLFNAAKAFLETDINYEDINLALIPQLKEVLYDEKSTIDWLSEVRLIGSVLGEVLTQEGLLEWYADVVNKMLVIDGEQLLTIYNSDFSLFANYVDEKGHLKPEVISSLLTAGAALDWELISDDKITTKAFVDSFLQPAFEFSTNEQDRVYYLYQISFLEEAIESVIESQRFNNLLLEQINKLIDDNLPADANFSHFTKEDLDLNYNLFDEEATRQIFIAIEALKFDDFDELTKLEKIADIARILDLDNTKEITKNIFEIPLVEHLLRVVLTYEDLYILASDMLNDILSEAEIDFIVKPRHLMINEDYLTAEEYTNLVLAVYLSGYDIGVEITPAFIKALEEVVTYDGVAQTRLEHILEANIIYGYVDKYVENENARVKVAEILEKALASFITDFNYTINSDFLRVPALALDSEGRLKKTEFLALVKAFNSLDLESFDEFSDFTLEYFLDQAQEEKVVNVVTNLLESEWVYALVGKAAGMEEALALVAEIVTDMLEGITDISYVFEASDFDLRAKKYGIFNETGIHKDYINKDEIIALVRLAYVYGWLDISVSGLEGIDNLIADLLGNPNQRAVAPIDKILSSKIVVGLLDKVINLETSNLLAYYAELINKYVSDVEILDGLVITEEHLRVAGISDENGLIKPEEIRGLLELVYALDLSSEFNAKKILEFGKDGRNNNGKADYLDIFESSSIFYQLLSNLYKDEEIKLFVLYLLEDNADEVINGINYLEELAVNYQVVVEALFSIKTSEGLFDYLDLYRLLEVATLLELDLDNLDISLIEEFNYLRVENKPALEYLAEATTLRALFTAILNQEDLFPQVGRVVNELLSENGIDLTLAIDYQVVGKYDDDDGLVTASEVANLLRAAAALDYEGFNNFDIEVIRGLLEAPFTYSSLTRLEHVYKAAILTDLLEYIFNMNEPYEYLAELLNEELLNVTDNLGVGELEFSGSELYLGYQYFNYEAVKALVEAVSALKLDSFEELKEIGLIADIAMILDLDNTKEVTNNIFKAPLVEQLLTIVLSKEEIYTLAASYLTDLIAEANLDFELEVTASMLKIDEKWLTAEEYTNLVLAVYLSGYDLDVEITPAFIKDLETEVTYDNVTQTRLEHILEANIIYGYVDKYVENENARVKVAEILEKALASFITDFNYTINSDFLRVPALALDSEGRLKKTEFLALVKAFNSLDLESFDEFSDFTLEYFLDQAQEEKVVNVVTNLLESEWVYALVGKAAGMEEALALVAEIVTDMLEGITDISYVFEASDFDLRAKKYGIFNETGIHKDYINKDEIIALVRLAYVYDWLDISVSGLEGIDNLIADLLGNPNQRAVAPIDKILSSKIVVGLLDKVINLETSNLLAYYAELINKYVSDVEILDGLVITEEHLRVAGISDENGLIKPEEIRGLLELVYALDLSSEFNAKKILEFGKDGRNNNGKADYLDIFESSSIFYQLLSNLYKDEEIKLFVLYLLEDNADEVINGINYLEELAVNYQVVVEALFSIKTSEGLFDYLDLYRLLEVATLLELDLDNLDISLIEEFNYLRVENKPALEYLAEATTLRALFTAILNQEDLFPQVGRVVNELLSENGIDLTLAIDYQVVGKYDDDDGLVTASEVANLLRAAAALDYEGFNNFDIEVIRGLLEAPFTYSSLTRLEHVYKAAILTDLLEYIFNMNEPYEYLAELLNEELLNVTDNLGVGELEFSGSELYLGYQYFNYEAVKALVEAVSALKLDSFEELKEIGLIADIAMILDLDNTKEVTNNIFKAPLVEQLLTIVLSKEEIYTLAASYLTDLIAEANLDFELEVTASMLKIDEKWLTAEEYTNLVLAVYLSGYDLDVEITPAFIKALEEVVTYDGVAQTRLEHILEANIIYGYVDKYVENENARVKVAEILEKALASFITDFNYTINSDFLRVPALALDSEGRLKKTEFLALVKAFNSLDLESFDEFSDFTLEYFLDQAQEEKVVNVVTNLLESEWVYALVGKALYLDEVLEAVALLVTHELERITGVEHEFSSANFDIRAAKYEIFEVEGDYEGYIKKDEIRTLISLVFVYDWLDISVSDLASVDSLVSDLLLGGTSDGKVIIDKILESKLVVGLLDKVLNVETNGLSGYYQLVAERYLREVKGFEDVSLSDEIFNISGISDANEVINISEIRGLLEIVYILDLSSAFTVEKIFGLYEADLNNNGKSDYLDIFELSNLLYGVLSNLYKDSGVKEFALLKLEEELPALLDNEYTDGLDVDYEVIVDALFSIKTSDEMFDYLDIYKVLTVANKLNINYNKFEVGLLTDLGRLTIDGEDAINYLANTTTLRALFTAVLNQADLFPQVGRVLNKVLSDNNIDLSLEFDYQVVGKYDDVDGLVKASEIANLLRAVAALDYDLITNLSVDNLYELVVGFLDKPFALQTETRLEYLYKAMIITDLLEYLVEMEAPQEFALNLINEEIEKMVDRLAVDTSVEFTLADLELGYKYFNYEAMRALIEAVASLNIGSFNELTKIKNINDVADILALSENSAIARQLFEVPLIEHLLTVVLSKEEIYQVAADFINNELAKTKYAARVTTSMLKIDEKWLTADEYTNLVLAVYLSGYDLDVEITPVFIRALEEVVTYDGVAQTRLEHILAANILYGYTDKYLENENARVKVAEIIEDILTKNIKNFNYNINSDLLRAPALALDSEGRLNKAEVIHLVSAFNKLDLESFNELTSISLNYIINDLGEARVVTVFEELLESEWAYFIIGRALRYEGLLELLAEEATKRLKKITDVEHEFSVSDFDIREAKYGIFETSGEYEGYVARTELLALVKLVFAYDWLAIKADSLVSIDNLVRDFLGYTDEAVIDKLLDSKVVVALLDKLLNVETNNLGSYYIEVLNKQLAKRSLTEGLVLGDNIFNISGISGADEVIKTSEIKGLLEIVYLLNLSEGINVERAFTIYSADRNGNDESDFIEIFERTAFIRGLISNVYKDENVKEFALELVEDKVDPKVKEISLLKDLEVDYQLIVEALFAILDENGEFDYLDIGRVLAVLNELNVKGTNDLKLSLVDEVRNNTIDSEDMIYYLANTKAVRYVLSSVLKQPELFSFAAKLVNEKLNTNLETDYQIGSEYDDLLDGYISATHLEALLRAGIGLDISALRNVSLDNLYEIVVGLLDDPYVREGSRLYFVYESLIITDLIKLVVENEALQDWGIGKVNTYLEKVINKFELTDIELLTSADLMISYEGLFDYEAALALLEAVSELNVTKTSDLTKARSINDVAEILKLPYGRETAEELFETPQVRHFIEVFANHDLGYQIVSGIINKYAKKVNLEVSAEDLKVDASYFTSEELTTLLIALYMSGYDVGMAITPALIKNLEEFVVYLNISQERLYFFLDSVIITKLINKAINSENLKGKLLAKVEDKLNDVLNTNLEIPVSLLRAPSVALDGEGNLLRTEIMALVKAFNSLGLGSFNEVTRYTEPRYITENVDTDALLDELLKSEWAYFVIGKAISNDEVLELVAKIATKVVSKLFKEDHQFEAADFYFDDSRYDVLIESGKYEGYLEKEEIKLLARLALEAVPYYDSFSGLGSIPGVIKEMFNDLDENDKSYIDRLFESELFVAAMDKVFNIEHSTMTTNIETLYLSILNSKLSSKGLTLVADDNIFEYHDDVYDNNMMVKKEEVRLLLAAITYLDISDIGLKMILDLVNDEDEEGKTSFDHIFESLIIHSVVSKMMLNERILGVVVDKVNSRQDTLTFTIDLIEVPSEMVEEDLVSVDELKKVLEAFNLMGIESLDLSSVGVEMITNLYGANEVDGKDDLDRLLDSLYIYVIIDRMLKGEAIGNLIATMASGMLDKDITYFDTTPQDDHLDANGGIKKDELRAAVYSLVLLDLTGMPDGDSVTLTDLLALIDQNTDPMTNVDDMHRFLAGDYFHYILQKALTSLSFREMVADGAEIEVDDFDLVSAKDDDGIMSKTEVYNLFRGLKILGINDFSNVEFDIETIINLDTIDFDLLFESSFIYQIIDLTIKDQLDDIPEGALVEDINSKYYDYVKKDELRALLEILKELDATDPNDINAYNVTVGMLRNFLDKDSAIFNRFLSKQIIEELGALNEESYVSGSEKDLTPDELRSFVDALEILLGSEQSLGDLDFGELTVTTNQFNDVLNIEADNDGTHVVNRMLSKAIIEGIDDIPEAAYVLDSDDKDIERTEIEGLQKVINILKLENMSDDINVDIVSVDDLGEIVDVNTLIVNKLVSDSIKGVFDDIPAAAYDDKGVILNSEMKRIVASLTALDVDNVTKASEIDASDITGTKLTGVANAESLIVYRLITTQVGDAGLVIPIEAYDGDDISKDELLALADTLEALGMSVEDTSGIKADTIDDEMLRGVADAESLIVYRLITTQIEGTDLIIPDEAYVGDDISKTELLALADTLEALGMSVEDTSGIEAEDIDDTMLRGVANAESLIVYRLITTQVGDAGLTIPTEAYDGDDISKDELLALADTLESLGMSVEDTSGIEAELIDAEMLGKVATTESYIVKNLITSEVEDKLEVPDGAKDGEGYITEDELLALADTLTELESEGIDDVLELSGVDASYVSVDVLEILTESESKIVRRIVTKTLDNALDEATISVSDDAYDTNDDFTDEELDALIVALGILEVDSLDELFDKEPGDFTFNMINDIKNMDPKSYIIEAMFPGIYS